jgi:hypothetical protein
MTIPAPRFIAAGALAVAAVAAPIAIALTSSEAVTSVASPKCLSWFGNKDDGICLSYASQPSIDVGSPGTQFATGNAGNGHGGIGVSTGPLAPGTTYTSNMG